jgi:ribonuclease VapC
MVIDTSTLLAILLDEPERRSYNESIEASDSRVTSVATFVEVSFVLEARYGADGLRALDRFIERAGIARILIGAPSAGLSPTLQPALLPLRLVDHTRKRAADPAFVVSQLI